MDEYLWDEIVKAYWNHNYDALKTVTVSGPYRFVRFADIHRVIFHTDCIIEMNNGPNLINEGQTVDIPTCAMQFTDIVLREGTVTIEKIFLPDNERRELWNQRLEISVNNGNQRLIVANNMAFIH